jgi:hypothetical protein
VRGHPASGPWGGARNPQPRTRSQRDSNPVARPLLRSVSKKPRLDRLRLAKLKPEDLKPVRISKPLGAALKLCWSPASGGATCQAPVAAVDFEHGNCGRSAEHSKERARTNCPLVVSSAPVVSRVAELRWREGYVIP